eukprot:gene12332-8460_t
MLMKVEKVKGDEGHSFFIFRNTRLPLNKLNRNLNTYPTDRRRWGGVNENANYLYANNSTSLTCLPFTHTKKKGMRVALMSYPCFGCAYGALEEIAFANSLSTLGGLKNELRCDGGWSPAFYFDIQDTVYVQICVGFFFLLGDSARNFSFTAASLSLSSKELFDFVYLLWWSIYVCIWFLERKPHWNHPLTNQIINYLESKDKIKSDGKKVNPLPNIYYIYIYIYIVYIEFVCSIYIYIYLFILYLEKKKLKDGKEEEKGNEYLYLVSKIDTKEKTIGNRDVERGTNVPELIASWYSSGCVVFSAPADPEALKDVARTTHSTDLRMEWNNKGEKGILICILID